SQLIEEQRLGDEVREQGRLITPTLIKYAGKVDYLERAPRLQLDLARRFGFPLEEPPTDVAVEATPMPIGGTSAPEVRLVHWDRQGEEKRGPKGRRKKKKKHKKRLMRPLRQKKSLRKRS
ncbi:MAG: hypothetical protein IH946_11255, partial [Bacteroidetes bacterium]|nr:hypothetical protein [Bacteroidota bacterium]